MVPLGLRLPRQGTPPVPIILRIAAVAFIVGIIVHLVFVGWSGLRVDLLIPILVTGVLVGFCEETLFRGIPLRGLRADGRTEAIGTPAHR